VHVTSVFIIIISVTFCRVNVLRAWPESCQKCVSPSVQKLNACTREYAGIPSAVQRLIYAGRQLEDGQTLAEYDVERGALSLRALIMAFKFWQPVCGE